MAKILVTENVHEIGPATLRNAGHKVIMADRNMDIVIKEIVDADAILTRILELPASLLENAKNLKHISKHGVGVDNIPLDYCREHGIAVTIAPGANSQSVAEHALSLMLALAKNLKRVSNAYQKIGFAAKNSDPGMEIDGKTVGVIGCGRIGSRMARMCVGLGMRVLVYDPYLDQIPPGAEKISRCDELFQQADVVTLHCLLSSETQHFVSARELSLMKPTAVLINCARGPVVDEPALIEALQKGRIAGAGLDVTAHEPCEANSPLFQMENVILTPHYAPTTREASYKVSQIAAQNILDILNGKKPEGLLE